MLVSGVDESLVTDPDPAANVLATAELKATAVSESLSPQAGNNAIILAADTTVALNGRMLNKPAHIAEATEMLKALRGQTHQVHTGFTLVDLHNNRQQSAVTTCDVTMRHYSDAEIEAYVNSGDPLDKAGAYSIQHPDFRPVASMRGCYLGVMGLSICHLLQHLRSWHVADLVDLPNLEQSHKQYTCCHFAKL